MKDEVAAEAKTAADEGQHGTKSSPAHPTSTSEASSKSTASRSWLSSVRRPRTSPGPKPSPFKRSLIADDDARRDSALTHSNSTASTRSSDNAPAPSKLHKVPSLPTIVVQDDEALARRSKSKDAVPEHVTPEEEQGRQDLRRSFHGIDTIIPTGSFDDLMSPSKMEFSKRGSILLGGKRANFINKQLGLVKSDAESPSKPTPEAPKVALKEKPKKPPPPTPTEPQSRSPSRLNAARGRMGSTRILSADEMQLSRKVRSMYQRGNESAVNWNSVQEEPPRIQESPPLESSLSGTPLNGSSLTVDKTRQPDSTSLRSPSIATSRESMIAKEPTEAAGGVEDWADLDGVEVDRYGFIQPKKDTSRDSTTKLPEDVAQPKLHRVSTALQVVSEEPRRKRSIRRTPSKTRSAISANPSSRTLTRQRSKNSVQQTASVYSSSTAVTSRSTVQNPLRNAANRLPHNRDRRWVDEASDMLTLPPGLADLEEQKDGGRAATAMRKKEWQREEKWRRMAKVVASGADAGGMMFEFDTNDPKLISRTWKGIPDRWRTTAWYAFLASSAKAKKYSSTDEELIESFYELQEENSADDVQIDVDVPRTINRHIMFRRRYRGGQRLLFRVLHAMSLYLPDTGYVQGMAALAATLLCYYEEDKAFVMLVRLWQLRGLEKLYEPGFAGLMEALDDFEKNWLRQGDVAKKLEELGITSTAYGTRWYLTLFNYSLPFPAQLRVWDVFMLLGDASNSHLPSSSFGGDLDVLHATSAALIDATREILLDSDFENAMKVLTSWIPIKDEDLLMRVARVEYKMRKKRANAA